MRHILEDLTHKMEGQPQKKEVKKILGMSILYGGYPKMMVPHNNHRPDTPLK